MNILITGGLGLIGHNLVNKFCVTNFNVTIIDNKTNYGFIPQPELDYLISKRFLKLQDCKYDWYNADISDTYAMSIIFKKVKPDIVIHLASFPRQKIVNNNPCLGSRVMSEGLLNLLESSVKNNVKKFVYVSSSMVYGSFNDDVKEDYNCNPQGQYGIMKLAGEWLVKDYSRKGYFNYTILRPSAVYGPLDVEDRVISKFILHAMRNQVLKVNGVNEKLDFTFVDDAVDGIIASTLSSNTYNKTYNITKSHSHTLYYAANLAVNIVGKGTIEVKDKDIDFPSRGSLNIDLARKDFGYDPKIDVEEGFQIYFNWLKNSEYYNK